MNLRKKPLSITCLAFAIFLAPPFFSRAFALFALSPTESTWLWVCSAVFLLFSIVFFRKDPSSGFRRWSFIFLSVFALELGFRVTVKRFLPDKTLRSVVKHGIIAYAERWRYRGHPFLQFTGNPDYLFDGSWVNQSGFYGEDKPYEKPANTFRVVTLGASSSRHYPSFLEEELNRLAAGTGKHFEVLNFGLDSYSSMHSVLTWVMLGVEYDPDYVVFHHAPSASQLRPDYSDQFKHFEPKQPWDGQLIRFSVLYRELRNIVAPLEGWYFFHKSVLFHKEGQPNHGPPTRGLKPFERNVSTITHVAKGRSVVPVLTTHPRSPDPEAKRNKTEHLDRANQLIRNVFAKHKKGSLLVDLAKAKEFSQTDLFLDLVHVNEPGDWVKAKHIASAIYTHLKHNSPHNKNLALAPQY